MIKKRRALLSPGRGPSQSKWCARVPMTEGGMRSSVLFWPDWIVKKKRFLKANATFTLAKIYAWTNEPDQALQLLDHSLNTPNGVTVAALKLDPIWDPLRSDPRFRALIDKYGAKS